MCLHDRAYRRAQEARLVETRLKLHLVCQHSFWEDRYRESGDCSCWCQRSARIALSVHPFSCSCSKRQKGRPRVWRGMCDYDVRRRVYAGRNQVRRIRREVKSASWDSDYGVGLLVAPRR